MCVANIFGYFFSTNIAHVGSAGACHFVTARFLDEFLPTALAGTGSNFGGRYGFLHPDPALRLVFLFNFFATEGYVGFFAAFAAALVVTGYDGAAENHLGFWEFCFVTTLGASA
mmetsp:Transcript_25649/g.36529  ORF Transcript_25649/g.36529 Transcript_25649/m.36529 type:complete len:114 (+) Transcript_25649:296-637(+)